MTANLGRVFIVSVGNPMGDKLLHCKSGLRGVIQSCEVNTNLVAFVVAERELRLVSVTHCWPPVDITSVNRSSRSLY